MLIDLGIVSEAATQSVETDAHGWLTGVRVLATTGRIRDDRSVADLDQRADPPEASFTARPAHRSATTAGRPRYKLRQQTIEPAFEIIKECVAWPKSRSSGRWWLSPTTSTGSASRFSQPELPLLAATLPHASVRSPSQSQP